MTRQKGAALLVQAALLDKAQSDVFLTQMANINVGQKMTILYEDDHDLDVKGFDARLLCYSESENLLIFKRENSEVTRYGVETKDADDESAHEVEAKSQQKSGDTDDILDSDDGTETYGENTEEFGANRKQVAVVRRSEEALSLGRISPRLGGDHFPCPSCNKVFSSSFTRERHRKEKHTSTKVYSCERCSKIFSRKYQLTRHNIKCTP